MLYDGRLILNRPRHTSSGLCQVLARVYASCRKKKLSGSAKNYFHLFTKAEVFDEILNKDPNMEPSVYIPDQAATV